MSRYDYDACDERGRWSGKRGQGSGRGKRFAAQMIFGPGGSGRHGGGRREFGDDFGGDWSDFGRAFAEGFGGGSRRGGRGGRGGPRGRMFASGELRLVLLALIAEQSRHGYELIKAIEGLTGGSYAPSPGVVYPTLSLLFDEGAVDEVADDSPRKAFAVTEQGTAELAERKDEADALMARLKSMDETADRPRSPALGRAVKNLFLALRGRMTQDFDQDTIHAVAEILDDAARRIERI